MTAGPFVRSQSVVSYAIRTFSNASFCVDTAQLVFYRIHVTCVRRNCTDPPPQTPPLQSIQQIAFELV